MIITLMTLPAGKLVFHVSLDYRPKPGALSLWRTIQDHPVFNNSSPSKAVPQGPSGDTAFLLNGDLTKDGVLHEDRHSSLTILGYIPANVREQLVTMFHAHL